MEDQVMDRLARGFPCPLLSKVWVNQTRKGIKDNGGPAAEDAFDALMDRVDHAALHTSLSDTAEEGTGLDPNIPLPTMCDIIPGPMVLELRHLTDIGISAFELERVRYNRDRSFHLKMRALSIEGKVATEDGLLEMKRRLPQYPHKCLKLTLSDGTVELDAIELEPLGLRLGATPMGTKIRLVDIPVRGGMAYLKPGNVEVLGGRVEALECVHRSRLALEFYDRMQEELVLAQENGVAVEQLFANLEVSPALSTN